MRSTIRSVVLAFAVLGCTAAARAETTNCTEITTTVFMITSPGIYCLKNNHAGAIYVQASDVVIDLNGHVFDSLTPGASAGIHAFERQNITVRNGTVRGFETAIQFDGASSRGHLIERMRITDNAGAGISIRGDGSVVRHNMMINNGYASTPGAKWSLMVSGDGVHVTDNQVVETGAMAIGEVVGIRVFGSGVAIERNVVANAEIGAASTRGILVFPTGPGSVVGNRVTNMVIGIYKVTGPCCSGAVVFMDNTVGGAKIPFSGGVMAGTTNTSF